MRSLRAVTRRQKKNGEEFLKLQLGDASGAIEAVVWEDVDEIAGEARLGTAVRVYARFSCDQRYGSTLTVRRLRSAQPEEFDPDQLSEGPPIPYEQMIGDLENLIGPDEDLGLVDPPAALALTVDEQDDAVGGLALDRDPRRPV